MNKFASFDFNDADKINKLLETHPLAPGTNVFTSEGKLVVMYQDGEEETPAVKIVRLKEQIRAFEASKAELVHSNKVMDTLIADAESRVEIAQADVTKIEKQIEDATSNKARKELREELARAQAVVTDRKAALREAKNQKVMNDHEIGRLELNAELFKEQIAALSK